MKFRCKYRQGSKYKNKTFDIDYAQIKDDFWTFPGSYDLDKVFRIIREWIKENGGGYIVRVKCP